MGFSAAYKLSKKRMQQNAGKTLTELFNESRGDEERSAQQISVKREGYVSFILYLSKVKAPVVDGTTQI